MLRHRKIVFLFLFVIIIGAVFSVAFLTRKPPQSLNDSPKSSIVSSAGVKKSDKENYTVAACLNRFKTEKEFLGLIETGPNVTTDTKVLATPGGGLFTGKGFKKTKDGKIVEAFNADTDPRSATVAEIKEALREKESTVLQNGKGDKISPMSSDEVEKGNFGEN